MTKQIISASKIIALAVVLSFGLSYVYAWTAPSATPPTGNVTAPINTGDNTQYKAGNLVLNDSLLPFTNGLIVRYGNVGIGTTNPGTKLDVVGGIRSASATSGTACTPLGSQAYESTTGAPLYCSNTNVWKAADGGGAYIDYADCQTLYHSEASSGTACGSPASTAYTSLGTCPNNYLPVEISTGLRYPGACQKATLKCCRLH